MTAPLPKNERQRLAAIADYQLGGIGREEAFDRVTALTSELFEVPMSVVSIVESDIQSFRGACGIDGLHTSRDVAFCAFAILKDEVMVVPDATKDDRFCRNPLVTGPPYIRFYAGAPLHVGQGLAAGTLCIIDSRPRDFPVDQQKRLARLAETVVDLIEMRVERFRAEEQRRVLREQRTLLELIVENSSEGIALFDRNLRLILWNEGFSDLFGYDGLVRAGMSAGDLLTITAGRGELGQGDTRDLVEGIWQSLRSGMESQREMRRSDGQILDVRRKTLSGGHIVLTARNVTQERQMAQLKDELISTVSHELRTPLATITGSLGLLAQGQGEELPSRVQRLITLGQRNAERLTLLVDDLLDMDKLHSGKVDFRFQPTDLGELLADAVEQNQSFAEGFGVTLRLHLPDQPVIADIDPQRIVQVVTNLLSNAAKFSDRGGTVDASIRTDQDCAVIIVADSGPGVAPEFRHRLFQRFEQEHGAHQEGRRGTGLGLAISKAIVDAHKGTIMLDESVRKGATFCVRLPLSRLEEGESA